jgi:hypothetical protein
MRHFVITSPRFAGSRFASTLQLHDIIIGKKVKSVSNWTWGFCDQFVDIVHHPTLSLSTGSPLYPSAEVFGRLFVDDEILQVPPKDEFVYAHCNIEGVMKNMGLQTMADGSPNPNILKDNQDMVNRLSRARREELSRNRHEKTIDLCAQRFLMLCGFNDSPFSIEAAGDKFKIFGKMCYSDSEFFVVMTPNDDLVLVFEDKSLPLKKVIKKKGHLGQIVGELLQLLSMNRSKKVFRKVFAVRFIDYRVTAFRIDPEKSTLDTLCATKKVPKKKLQLLCNVENPMTNPGLSLIDSKERVDALHLMANMRQFILNNEK